MLVHTFVELVSRALCVSLFNLAKKYSVVLCSILSETATSFYRPQEVPTHRQPEHLKEIL